MTTAPFPVKPQIAIVNPDVLASRSIVFMRNVDGVWKFEGGNELQRWEGSSTCPSD